MGFSNLKAILRRSSGLDAIKFLLLQGTYSRPAFAGVATALLAPMYSSGEMPIGFTASGRRLSALVRKGQQLSDFYSVLELGVLNVYPLDPAFDPDLVVDGGGNIGMFTLVASAAYPRAEIRIGEPVPDNLAQIRKHLAKNHVKADIWPVCIGGSAREVSFYCREANQGSFDATKPYDEEIKVSVVPLAELTRGDAKRILIKLDIEGMELEALASYVPGEQRAVFVLGELHGHPKNHAELERIFGESGWKVRFSNVSDADSVFEAWSPAALAS